MKFRFSLLLVVLFASSIYRLIDIGHLPAGAYWDELDTGYQAYSLLKTGRDYFANSLPFFIHSFADYRSPIIIYSSAPLVKLFGLNITAIRLNSVIWGLIALIGVYLLAATLFSANRAVPLISVLLCALTPWHFQYSRLGFEPICGLALVTISLVALLRSFRRPALLPVATIVSPLSLYTYSTAKFFIPVIIIALLLLWHRSVAQFSKKILIASFLLGGLLSLGFITDSLRGQNNTRFAELSIFNNPTLKSDVNTERYYSLTSAAGYLPVGSSPRFIDKLFYNAPMTLANTMIQNFVSSFSTEFLFTQGDPNLRHNPGRNVIGQLLLPDMISICIGVYVLMRRRQLRVLGIWLLLAPLPAMITRDGNMHASRLILMLPPLVIISAAGVFAIRRRLVIFPLVLFYVLSALHFAGAYFTQYRLESPRYFQWGFMDVVKQATAETSKYDHIFIDTHKDFSLMAYLVATEYDPRKFQSLHPLRHVRYGDNYEGLEFGKIVLLYPGERDWLDIKVAGRSLAFVDAGQPVTHATPENTLLFPDITPAFYRLALH